MNKIGLSLGGGSLRGVAHIGVIKELENRNIPISYIAGTSSGALIGGLYASGMTPDQMIELFQGIDWGKYIDIRFPKFALLKGKRIYQDLVMLTGGKHFKDLSIPFSAICIDLTEGHLKVVNEGEVAKAIRASIAIPGIFHPVKYGDNILVDGYILNNNPADIVKMMGADYVIASEVKGVIDKVPVKGVITSLQKYMNIASVYQTYSQLEKNADLIIKIDCEKYGKLTWKTFSSLGRYIEEGLTQTAKAIATLEDELKLSVS